MSEVLKKGLNEQKEIKQKAPRSEVKGSQKPVNKKEKLTGKFKMC